MGFNGDWKRWCPLDFKGATVKNDANNGDLTWFKPAKLCGVGLLSWFTSLIFHCWIYGRRIERVNGVNMFTKCDVFVLGAIPKTYDYPLVNIQKAMEAMAHWVRWFTHWKMVIFYSFFICLPEGRTLVFNISGKEKKR
jgi:hypothetical protein